MKNLLFPEKFQIVGWLLFIPSTIMALICFTGLYSTSGVTETLLNDGMIIGIALGALFIVC